MRKIYFLLFVCLFSSPLLAGKKNTLPQLRCEKKWGDVTLHGKKLLRYRLRANHFPEGKRFNLIVKWFDGEEAETLTYVANKNGHLILEEKREDPLYALCPLKKGETIEFLMRAEDDLSFYTGVALTPFPLTFSTKTGIDLSLELRGKNGDLFHLLGKGFYSGEFLQIACSFEDQKIIYPIIASSQGKIAHPLKLSLHDRDGGECLLQIIRSTGETLSFPFNSGNAALQLVGGFLLEIK